LFFFVHQPNALKLCPNRAIKRKHSDAFAPSEITDKDKEENKEETSTQQLKRQKDQGDIQTQKVEYIAYKKDKKEELNEERTKDLQDQIEELKAENKLLIEKIDEQTSLLKGLTSLIQKSDRQLKEKVTDLGSDVASIQNVIDCFVKSQITKTTSKYYYNLNLYF